MKKVALVIISLLICVSWFAERNCKTSIDGGATPFSCETVVLTSQSNGDCEGSMLLKHLWETADNYVAENAESFISVIRKTCPDIPEEAEVECSQGRCSISAEEIAEERQLVLDISSQALEGMPESITNFIRTGDYTLNPKYYGVMTYKFTWTAPDEFGADKLYYETIEQLYELNLNPQTVEISPVISYFALRDSFTADEENTPVS